MYVLCSFRVLELLRYSSSQVLECLNRLASLFLGEPESQRELFRRELILFYSQRGSLYKSEKERECIRVLPSLVAHVVWYEMVISAHNTIHV